MATDEENINISMAITGFIATAVAAIGAGVAYLFAVIDISFVALLIGMVLTAVSAGAGWGTMQFLDRANPSRVQSRTVEHVLTLRQRRELRRKRGEVVLEKALIEVEQERDNITHRALEAANDPDKPPHPTQWTPEAQIRRLPNRGDDPWKQGGP